MSSYGLIKCVAPASDVLRRPDVLYHGSQCLPDQPELVSRDEAEQPGGEGNKGQQTHQDEEVEPSW